MYNTHPEIKVLTSGKKRGYYRICLHMYTDVSYTIKVLTDEKKEDTMIFVCV